MSFTPRRIEELWSAEHLITVGRRDSGNDLPLRCTAHSRGQHDCILVRLSAAQSKYSLILYLQFCGTFIDFRYINGTIKIYPYKLQFGSKCINDIEKYENTEIRSRKNQHQVVEINGWEEQSRGD